MGLGAAVLDCIERFVAVMELFSAIHRGRLCLFWDSPIAAGAVLSCIFPYLIAAAYGTPCRRFVVIARIFAAGLGVVSLFLLALTQSRGPLAATIASSFVMAAMLWCQLKRIAVILLVGTTTALLVFCVATPARSRITSDFIQRDESIKARMAVVHSYGAMLKLSPFRGIGTGESGYLYSQWFSPPENRTVYRTVYNTFVEVAIEQGIILGIFLLAISLGLICASFNGVLHDARIVAATGSL